MNSVKRERRVLGGMSLGVVLATGVATLLVLGGFAGTAAAADPPGLKDAARMVETNAKTIVGFAYPTAKKVTGTEFMEGSKAIDDSFSLTYAFDYADSDGDAAYVTLKFRFNKAGKMLGITEVGRSSVWPSFGTAKLVLELIKEGIRNDPKARNSPEGKALLAIDEPTAFLSAYLNVKAGK